MSSKQKAPMTPGSQINSGSNSVTDALLRQMTQSDRAPFNTHNIAVVTMSIRISLWISAVGFILDMAGYLLFYRLFLHHQAERDDVMKFAFVPEVAALIFGMLTWLGLLYSGIIGSVHFSENITCSKITLSLALSVNFIMDTSLGFIFDHFVFSHNEINWQNECVLSKLMSLACLALIFTVMVGYSYCRYGRVDQWLTQFTESILFSYQASHAVFDNNLGAHSSYVDAETSAEAAWVVAKSFPRIFAECFLPISYWFQKKQVGDDSSRSSMRYSGLANAEEEVSPSSTLCCC